jgi:hypothetical protein
MWVCDVEFCDWVRRLRLVFACRRLGSVHVGVLWCTRVKRQHPPFSRKNPIPCLTDPTPSRNFNKHVRLRRHKTSTQSWEKHKRIYQFTNARAEWTPSRFSPLIPRRRSAAKTNGKNEKSKQETFNFRSLQVDWRVDVMCLHKAVESQEW